jgi:hypothetical protein
LIVNYAVYLGDSNVEVDKGTIDLYHSEDTVKELGYYASSDSDEAALDDTALGKYGAKKFGDKDVTLKVLFTVTFDSNATDSMKSVRALEDITISLEQVRDTAGYYTTSS